MEPEHPNDDVTIFEADAPDPNQASIKHITPLQEVAQPITRKQSYDDVAVFEDDAPTQKRIAIKPKKPLKESGQLISQKQSYDAAAVSVADAPTRKLAAVEYPTTTPLQQAEQLIAQKQSYDAATVADTPTKRHAAIEYPTIVPSQDTTQVIVKKQSRDDVAIFDVPTQRHASIDHATVTPSQDTTQVIVKSPSYNVTVVIPTRNERDNVRPLLKALDQALQGLSVEVIFVDDSDDETPAIIEQISLELAATNVHVNLEHRPKGPAREGGLATAVVLGMDLARADYVAVIDADLQHPPEQLRVFYDLAYAQNLDLVLASRYIKGGSYEGLDGISRLMISVGLKWTAKLAFPEHLMRVSDPLGGFFLLRRALLTDVVLRPVGYKILMEILLRCPWKKLREVPYAFQARANGQSKASMRQGILVLSHIWRLFCEVPSAARVWKISGLLLMNVLFTALLFLISQGTPGVWRTASLILFVGAAGLNFWLVNRFIFPRTPQQQQAVPASKPVPTPIRRSTISSLVNAVTAPLQVPGGKPSKYLWARGRKPLIVTICLAVILATALICYLQPGAWILIAAVLIGMAILLGERVEKQQLITMILGVAVGVSSIDYLAWRFSVSNWPGWWIAVPLLAAETFGALHTFGFQYTLWPWTPSPTQATEDPTLLPIFIFIPTVNEGPTILKPTLEGVLAARNRYLKTYPSAEVRVVVCNDGRVANVPGWEKVEELTTRMGVECVTRTVGGGAKAGNIEHARRLLQATGNTLLVIFDADQVARPDFLLKTVPHFADSRMGWVQTGQYYGNQENPVSRWADDQQAMFYNLQCPGKSLLNAVFICGTNVVIRSLALDQIGGLPQDSVTEDFAASIALHPTWHSTYITDVLATGLGPLDVPSYLKQQRRWAIGTLSVMRDHWRDILLPRKNGLSLNQRIHYLLACTHYLCGLRDLIYLVCPILFILTGTPAVRGSTLGAFLIHFLPYWIASLAGLWYAGRGVTGLCGIIMGFGSFPVLLESLLAVILKRKSGFTVTSKKRGSSGRSWTYLWPYFFFWVLGVVGLVIAAHANVYQQASMLISALWVLYSMVLLSSFLWLNLLDARYQAAAQRMQREESNSNLYYASRLQIREQSFRPIWNIAFALCLAGLLFTSGTIHLEPAQPAPFLLSQQKPGIPYGGVALPVQWVNTRVGQLDSSLNAHFSIVGRTQDIHDLFDTKWATQLNQQNEHPWITLEFGVFGANGQPPTDASLAAIANGVQDANIERWAQSIRAYGRPVYLTVLLEDDRNWAISSAVAHGGIPAESTLAWQHVRSLFKAAGALNVAWIWAPADPAHDRPYAPPASSIDGVLLSLISYPNTPWADPQRAIQSVRQRYPNKPILLEVTASGPAPQKASWLDEVGQAVLNTPNVYALIYHEGSPAIDPTAADNQSWSMISDADTQVEMRKLLTELRS